MQSVTGKVVERMFGLFGFFVRWIFLERVVIVAWIPQPSAMFIIVTVARVVMIWLVRVPWIAHEFLPGTPSELGLLTHCHSFSVGT